MIKCSLCGRELLNHETLYEEIYGWAKKRAGGGAHGVTVRKPTGRVGCMKCIQEKKKGLEGQVALEF